MLIAETGYFRIRWRHEFGSRLLNQISSSISACPFSRILEANSIQRLHIHVDGWIRTWKDRWIRVDANNFIRFHLTGFGYVCMGSSICARNMQGIVWKPLVLRRERKMGDERIVYYTKQVKKEDANLRASSYIMYAQSCQESSQSQSNACPIRPCKIS